MEFRKGDRVEVASKLEGFVGSYYAATVVSEELKQQNKYVVQYKNLVKDDHSGPLQEIVTAEELRPMPPIFLANWLGMYNKVDAFDNDGWWVGKIVKNSEDKYLVYFEDYNVALWYPGSRLRAHLEWKNNNWFRSINKFPRF